MAIEIHVLEIQEKVAFDEDRTRGLYILAIFIRWSAYLHQGRTTGLDWDYKLGSQMC